MKNPSALSCGKFLRLLFASSALCALSSIQAKDIYVAVDGSDQPDGSQEKPYASLQEAVEAVRDLREAAYHEPVVIYLREGRHQLDNTLVLGMEDSAPARGDEVAFEQYGAGEIMDPYLTISAFPGENPVLSGSVPVTGWQRLESSPPELPSEADGKVWVAEMPSELERFYTIYDGEGRLNRARNSGFAYTKPGNQRTLHFPEGALKNWENLEDVEVQVRPGRAWAINMLPLASVDEEGGVATTGASATYGMGPLPGYLHDPDESVVWVENILEALDEPGEWVVNTKTRKIYLWPSSPAKDGSPQGILAPAMTELIRVEGEIDYDGSTDKAVRGIAFKGLKFSHADRWAWKSDEGRVGWGMQHDWDMFDRPTALLRFRGAEECQVKNCSFTDSGGSGVRLDLHAQRNRIVDSEFAHLGEAGILLAGYGPGTKDVNHHNDVINNHIHHFSEITWHSPGLWAWQSGHNRMVHNELSHSGYAAALITTRVEPDRGLNGEGGRTIRQHEIAAEDKGRSRGGYASWKKREKYNHARHNLFEYNDISHCVQLLSDGNGIYVSGTGTGNIVRYNYVHHNLAEHFPAPIRCDDDQHETLIYGNVLYKNAGHAAGIATKGVNDVINNFIVATARKPRKGFVSFEWAPVTGSKVQRNIIIAHPDGGVAMGESIRNGQTSEGPKLETTKMDFNLYYHPSDEHWMDEHFSRMRIAELEKNSLAGDPMFVNPEGGDFSFQPGSPALELGIEPLNVSKMGRLNDSSLLISDGSKFIPQEMFPKFSWDTTPQYFMFGDKERVLTPEEVEFIARQTDFICIEKSHGYEELGAAELGAKHEAEAFKKINPDAKVLFYFNAALAWSYTSYGKDFTRNRIAKNPELREFLLTNPKTGRLADKFGSYLFDVLNPDFRSWWVETVAKGVRESGCDGAFIDQMHGNSNLHRGKNREIEQAMGEMMADLKKAIGSDKILLGNNANSANAKFVYPVCDALMFENYSASGASKENLLVKWGDMLKNAKKGKISVFRLGVEGAGRGFLRSISREKKYEVMPKISQEKLEFALACYLIGAQPYSYFMYSWGWTLADGSLVDYPELNKPLGPPKGAYSRTSPDGWEFTREFEHASVWVNTETREAKITWRE
ncbi:MAG: putative glycoside hydrolase [Luteolibacter sp.]